jgi:exopolysaccharide biosynthesis operon protein EpsL
MPRCQAAFLKMIPGVGVNSCFSKKDTLKFTSNSIIGVLILLTSNAASADQSDTLTYSVSAGVTYDDNLYKLPPGVDPQQTIGHATKSDVIKNETIGINLDKKYANQEVIFRGSVTNNIYNEFSNLDYTNTIYIASWNGNLTPRLSFGASDSRTQSLTTYSNVNFYTQIRTTVDSSSLNADWWFQSNWHLRFGLTKSSTKSSQSVINNQSYTSKVVEWGARFTPADGNSISLVSRLVQNENVNAVPNFATLSDSGNKESQQELNFIWILTGKSTLRGNFLSLKHQYTNFSQLDYSGVNEGLNYSWGISGQSSLNVSWNRVISSWIAAGSSYSMTDTASIAPSWQLSSKIGVQASISQSKSNFFGPITALSTARYDETRSETLSFTGSPQQSVKLSASIQNSHRYSNYSSFEYNNRSASLSAQINF